MKNIIILFLIFLIHIPNYILGQWQPTNGPYGSSVSCLTIKGANIFASASQSSSNGIHTTAVFQSSDNGITWNNKSNGFPYNCNINALENNGTIIFAGTDYGFFSSSNDGSYWTSSNNGLSDTNILTLHLIGGDIFAGTTSGVFVSKNNGNSWSSSNIGMPLSTVFEFAVIGANIFAATSSGIFLSTNNGFVWSAVNSGLTNTPSGLYIESIANIGSLIFAGTMDGVYLSSNNGNSWSLVNNNLPGTNMAVTSLETVGTSVFISLQFKSSSSLPSLFRSTNNGLSWSQIGSGINGDNFSNFSISSIGSSLYLCSYLGIHISNDNGSYWRSAGLGKSCNVNDILLSGSYIYAATQNGIYSSSDDGNSWSSVSTGLPSNTNVYSLEKIGATLYAGTNSGLFKSTTNATNWFRPTSSLRYFDIWDLEYINNLLFASVQSNSGNTIIDLYVSSDNGVSWSSSSNGIPQYTRISCIKSSGPVIFASSASGVNKGGIYISTNNGATWSSSNSGLANSGKKVLTLATDSNYVFAGSLNEGSNNDFWGGIFISPNYGSSWGNNTWGNYRSIYSLNKFGPLVVAGGNQIVYSTNLGDNWKTTSGAYGDQWSVLTSNPTEIFAGQRSFSLSPTVHIGVWKSSLLNLIDTTANLDENHISSNLSIYPNPTTDKLNLSFTSKNAKRISIRLLNLLGSEVFTDDIKIFSGNYTTRINLSNNEKGIYFLEITTNLGVSSKKIILQ
jgi:hypothetical protein